MKNFLISLLIISICLSVSAETMNEKPTVAVMDFGTYEGNSDPDFNLLNAERASSEYVIQRLVMKKIFDIIDKDIMADKLKAENLNTIGLIDPDTAKRIGRILGVQYLIYGNVTNVVLDENVGAIVKVKTVKAKIIARIIDVKTGNILMMSKGEGESKSSSVLEDSNIIIIGTSKVSQDSVHNALKKAVFQAVDILIDRLMVSSNKLI